MAIEIKRVSGIELYHRYPTQRQRQPCYVELDARGDGRLSASYDGEIGNAVPQAVWNRHVLRFRIPALRAVAANTILDEIAPLAERVVAGYSAAWDGGHSVGRHTEDASGAAEEIATLCEQPWGDGDEILVADAVDHFSSFGSHKEQARELEITAATTDEQLDVIEARELAAAREAGLDDVEGLGAHLRSLRDRLADEAA